MAADTVEVVEASTVEVAAAFTAVGFRVEGRAAADFRAVRGPLALPVLRGAAGRIVLLRLVPLDGLAAAFLGLGLAATGRRREMSGVARRQFVMVSGTLSGRRIRLALRGRA
jgi:hypothetical protein